MPVLKTSPLPQRSVSAEADVLLTWLARIEHEGAEFQSLHLEKRDRLLDARLVIKRV